MSLTRNYVSVPKLSETFLKFQQQVAEFSASAPSGPPPWVINAPQPYIPEGVQIDHLDINGVSCLKTSLGNGGDKAVLFIHGGAWVTGSMEDGLALLPEITRRSGVDGYSVEYTLVPGAVYPTQPRQCIQVYLGLLAMGYKQIAVAGVSAGANMSLAMALCLRDECLPAPTCVASMSAALDLSGAIEVKHPDFLSADIAVKGKDYAPDNDLKDPYVSPFFADWNNLPPILLQAGTGESFHEWHLALAERLEKENVSTGIELSLWENMTHGFALEGIYYPEGDVGREQVIEYILGHFT